MTADLCASKLCPKSLFDPVSQRKGPKGEMYECKDDSRFFDVIKTFSLDSRCVGSSIKERDSLSLQYYLININNFTWLQTILQTQSHLHLLLKIESSLLFIQLSVRIQTLNQTRTHDYIKASRITMFSCSLYRLKMVRSHSLTSSRPPHSLPRDSHPSHQCIPRRLNHHHFSTQQNCNPSP